MKTATDSTVMTSPEYRRFIGELKARVISARISAARAVNCDLILLYWDIGRGIVEKQQLLGWGESVVEMVSADLRRAFPGLRGFSPFNLWRMRQFYLEYSSSEFLAQAAPEMEKLVGKFLAQPVPELASSPQAGISIPSPAVLEQPVQELAAIHSFGKNPEILAQAVRELLVRVPWGHHVELLKKIKTTAARIYYLRATARFGWSRNVLLNQIKAGTYERAVTEKKSHNFALALPEQCAGDWETKPSGRCALTWVGNPTMVGAWQP